MSKKADDYKRTIRRLLIGLKSIRASLMKIGIWQRLEAGSKASIEKIIADAEDLLKRHGNRNQKRGVFEEYKTKKKGK